MSTSLLAAFSARVEPSLLAIAVGIAMLAALSLITIIRGLLRVGIRVVAVLVVLRTDVLAAGTAGVPAVRLAILVLLALQVALSGGIFLGIVAAILEFGTAAGAAFVAGVPIARGKLTVGVLFAVQVA